MSNNQQFEGKTSGADVPTTNAELYEWSRDIGEYFTGVKRSLDSLIESLQSSSIGKGNLQLEQRRDTCSIERQGEVCRSSDSVAPRLGRVARNEETTNGSPERLEELKRQIAQKINECDPT